MSLIYKAIQELSDRCDGAREKDGAGFNKPDSHLGKFLSAIPFNEWDPGYHYEAWKMLKKYQSQLAGCGIDYDAIEQPEAIEVGEIDLLLIDYKEGRFMVIFPYNVTLVDAVKVISGRSFNGGSKPWSVPVTSHDEMAEFAKKHEFVFSVKAIEALANIDQLVSQVKETQVKARVINLKAGKFCLKSEKNLAIIAEIKEMPGRKFDWEAKCWLVPVNVKTVPMVITLAERYDFVASDEAKSVLAQEDELLPDKLLEIKGNKFVFTFEYDPNIISEIKSLPGSKFHKSPPYWSVPIGERTADNAMSLAQGHGFHVRAGVKESVAEILGKTQSTIQASKAEDAEIEVSGLGGQLRPFQRAGVAYAVAAKRTFIADEMGLGKTIEALATLEAENAYPAVIICPASLKLNWEREAIKWLPRRSVSVVNGKSPDFEADVLVINYDIIGKHKEAIIARQNKAVVLDESHYCFTGDTQVLTDQGLFSIQDIVENRLPVCVASCNLSRNVIEYKSIKGYFRNELHQILVRVTHEHGEIICTANHQIWTDNGYTEAASLTCGTNLRMVQKGFYDTDQGEDNREVLQSQLCSKKNELTARSQASHFKSSPQANGRADLPMVQGSIYSETSPRQENPPSTVLLEFLRRSMADVKAGTQGTIPKGCQNSPRIKPWAKASRCLRAYEKEQPHVQPRNYRENAPIQAGANLPVTWRERSTDRTTTFSGRSSESANGIRDFDSPSQGEIPFLTAMLQSRFGYSRQIYSYRDRRAKSQNAKVAFLRQTEDRDFTSSRVVSVEIYKPTGDGRYGDSTEHLTYVYDLEVEDNHNYFVGGILVSNCKNYKAQRTIHCKDIGKGVPIRLCLTGTPVLNRPQELLSQLNFLGRLNDFGGFWEFAKRYCQAYKSRWGWDLTGAAHLDELNEKLRASCYLRRNKSDVLTELPAKQRSVVPIKIDNRREYQKAEKELIAWLGQKAIEDKDFLASIAHLSIDGQKQAKADQAMSAKASAQRAEQLVRIEALKQLTVKGKMKSITEWIESFLETGEKLVLFATHQETIANLGAHFDAPTITGQTPVEKRQEYVDQFQGDSNTNLICLNIQAGGVGLTLTAASNVAFIEQGWTPAAHDQAEDRCHRIGQKDSVNAWYLLADGTIDTEIYDLIESKRLVVDAATEGQGDEEVSVGILTQLLKSLGT